MTSDCLNLEPYLDGHLSDDDEARFETHVLECDACDHALALPELSALRDPVCPPEIVDRALTRAHRAPDRAPARRRSRRWVWTSVAAASMAVLAVAVVSRPPSKPVTVAESSPTTPSPESLNSETLTPETPAPDAADDLESASSSQATTAQETAPDAPPSRTAPSRTPSTRRAPNRPAPSAAPAAAPDLEVAQSSPDLEDAPDLEDVDRPSDADIAAAQRDLALTFQLVAAAQDRARSALEADAGPIATTLDQTLPF